MKKQTILDSDLETGGEKNDNFSLDSIACIGLSFLSIIMLMGSSYAYLQGYVGQVVAGAISLVFWIGLIVLSFTGLLSAFKGLRRPQESTLLAVVGLIVNALVLLVFLGVFAFVLGDIFYAFR